MSDKIPKTNNNAGSDAGHAMSSQSDKKAKTSHKQRIHLIDEIRGFAILCMVVYHAFYDLVAIFSVNIPIFYSSFIQTLVYIFVGIFVGISGTSSAFSRSNIIRGLKCFGIGMLMTVATYFFMPSQLIVFGILHMLGVSMMLYGLIQKPLKRIPPIALLIGCIILFILTYNVVNGYIGIGNIVLFELPRNLYELGFLFPFGFTRADFFSSDYFSLLPWFFCFVGGSALGRIIKENKMPNFMYKLHIRPLAFIGRNTLIIYILHQPVVYGVLYLIFEIING